MDGYHPSEDGKPRKGDHMTNQNILDTLSELECALYYRLDGHDDREGVSYEALQPIYNKINECLAQWHNITGLTIS